MAGVFEPTTDTQSPGRDTDATPYGKPPCRNPLSVPAKEAAVRDDLASAVAEADVRMTLGAGARRKLDATADGRLAADEQVVAAAHGLVRGMLANTHLLVVVTSARVLVLRRGLLARGTESVAVDSITGVSTGRRGLGATVKITGAGANDAVPGLTARDADRVASAIQHLIAHRGAQSTVVDERRPGLADRLAEVDAAYAAGLISADEYETLRRRALGL
jgi:hypothetical protein